MIVADIKVPVEESEAHWLDLVEALAARAAADAPFAACGGS